MDGMSQNHCTTSAQASPLSLKARKRDPSSVSTQNTVRREWPPREKIADITSDALANIGHACGHNLIATVGVAGALATANLMKAQGLLGKVILFGTPGEESLGGKVHMLEAGIFDDYEIDISLMAHPTNGPDTPYMRTFSASRFDVEYHGKPAHASAGPFEGINAQDA
jgi:metal-dependent amidase/aminoacylase/carboxypeptidase family protein